MVSARNMYPFASRAIFPITPNRHDQNSKEMEATLIQANTANLHAAIQ